jgi:hypothetical protein
MRLTPVGAERGHPSASITPNVTGRARSTLPMARTLRAAPSACGLPSAGCPSLRAGHPADAADRRPRERARASSRLRPPLIRRP